MATKRERERQNQPEQTTESEPEQTEERYAAKMAQQTHTIPQEPEQPERQIEEPEAAKTPGSDTRADEAAQANHEDEEQSEMVATEQRTLVSQKGAHADQFRVGDKVKQSPSGVTYHVFEIRGDRLGVRTLKGFWHSPATGFFHEAAQAQPAQEEPEAESESESTTASAEAGSKEDLKQQLQDLLAQ